MARKPVPTQRPKRPKRSLLAWLSLTLGSLLLIGSGVTLIVGPMALSAATKSVSQANLIGDDDRRSPAPGRQRVAITGAKTLLLVGIDAMKGRDAVLADSIIICYIPASHDAAYLVSIPRDTEIQIPAFNNGAQRVGGGTARINSAFSYGGQGLTGATARAKGTELLAKTIKQEFGITFDGAAIVDFDGFRSVVSALGGVDMVVDQETRSIHIGYTKDGRVKPPYLDENSTIPNPGVTPKVYPVGPHHFTPHEALDYVRQRKSLQNSDYDRQKHQQQFLKAMVRQATSQDTLTNPVKLVKLLNAVGNAMTIDAGGISLEDWVFAMRGITADNIMTIKTNNGVCNPLPNGAERLDAATTALLESIGDGALPAFMASHPDLVGKG